MFTASVKVLMSSVLTNAGDGDSSLQDLDGTVHGVLDGGEGADGRDHGLWESIQTQRCLGDDAQRSL